MEVDKMEDMRQMVKEILNDELKSLLADVTYRIGVLHDEVKRVQGETHRITSGMLNLATHQLDGFVITDNSPAAGKIAWTDCNIVYKGTSYAITDGSTDMKYVYWQADTTPTTFKFSNTKPVLTDDDVMICINNEGTHQMVIGIGRMTPGGSIIDGTIDSDEIADGAVLTDKIAALAITEGLLATGAVTVNKIGSGAVTEAKIGSNAVTDAKIKDGAVVADKIGSGAVTEAKIGSNAVTDAKIKAGAVSELKLADNAVTSGKIAQNAVVADKISSGAITEAKIAANAVTSGKIASGSVAENKLSIAMHLLF
jgi:uncharacterized small protein (DUF1192 family)/uncharacterized low-complexity protein